MDIREHGICVDKKGRVKCNYCGKEMSNFNLLEYHLGGVPKKVLPCEKVTLTLKETFRKMVMNGRPGILAAKRVREVQTSNSHNKRARNGEDSSIETVSAENGNRVVEADEQDLLSKKAQKSIARFFYENCIDFSVVDSPSFKEMMTVGGGGGQMGIKFPDSEELESMLQETLKEVQDHVKKTKDSWKITGCSILLDAWVDQKGHDLVSFVADCPAGPVYLRSFDVSDIKHNVTELTSLVEGLIEEVGVHNVIQIISCSTSGWVGELGKVFAGNEKEVFWSVSLSHCIKLMLLKIKVMDNFREVLDKVSNICEFIKTNPSVVNFLKDDIQGRDTIASSEFEFLTLYLLIEGFFKAKNKLVTMFASSNWSNEQGMTISKLVKDSSFWETLERFVKSTSPLVHGLLLFTNANNQHVGYVYDTITGIKVDIMREFNLEEECYKPLWDVIDDVWEKHLHSALHVTGYFLNPIAFYSDDFHSDREQTTGLITSLLHLVKERHIQVKITTQLDLYREGKGCFDEASQADQISNTYPAKWWAEKANQHPELQSFAIKVLSQTCEGASRYKLKRSVAEKLLFAEGMSHSEKQHLVDLAFVHYNLHLQSCKAKTN